MNATELRRKVAGIKVWQRRDERAPHKPLLLLYALARLSRDSRGLLPYIEVRRELTELLREFGPKRKQIHPEYPFVRLQNDNGLWQVQDGNGKLLSGAGDATSTELTSIDAQGGFANDVRALLRSEPELIGLLVGEILSRSFPESIHDDILEFIGFCDPLVDSTEPIQSQPRLQVITRLVRDPKFRQNVLLAYQHRCAICGFDVRVANRPVAIEAAHIKWLQFHGKNEVKNGIALCVMHHRLFDRGAFTIGTDFTLTVSDDVSGTNGVAEWLERYHGEPIRRPSRVEYLPAEEFIGWHHSEVFRGTMS